MVSRQLNKGKYRRMTRCRICRNAGVRGRTRRSSRRRITNTSMNDANRLFNSAFNSAVVKPMRRAFCCEANSDDISSSVQRENQMQKEKLKSHNKLLSQIERDSIKIDPRISDAYIDRFSNNKLSTGINNITAIRKPANYEEKLAEQFYGKEFKKFPRNSKRNIISDIKKGKILPIVKKDSKNIKNKKVTRKNTVLFF